MPTEVYTGTATTTVQFPNVYGIPGQPQTFQTNAAINVSVPRAAGGITESNPFHFSVSPDAQGLQSPGAISLWSAAPANGTLFEYWDIQFVSNTQFQGVLAEDHTEEALATNLINVPQEIAPHLTIGAMTLAMAQGTQLTGVIDSTGGIDLQIIGNTTDGAHPFQVNIDTSFVGVV